MKILVGLLFLFGSMSFSVASTMSGHVITAKVNGMVCAFCSNSLEKKFGKKKEVEKIKVDLDSKLITITLKKGKKLSEKVVRKTVRASGFDVVSVDMGKTAVK